MENKIYFKEGDTVELKQPLSNKPIMMVKRIDKIVFRSDNDDSNHKLLGIRCVWFNTNSEIQEFVFSSKDLVLVNTEE